MSYPYQETKEKWRQLNKNRINARRRELRKLRKNDKMKDKCCLLCEIRMIGNSYGTRLYCKDCNERKPEKVGRHKWMRYYFRTKDKKELEDTTSMAYFREHYLKHYERFK